MKHFFLYLTESLSRMRGGGGKERRTIFKKIASSSFERIFIPSSLPLHRKNQ
jgi:hypothetical protein